jgi:hypothetical protein
MESNMINKLLGAAAMTAVILAMAPASAAKMSIGGCGGENMMKTESMIEGMADGPNRAMAQKEVAMAQTAMLDGKMRPCAMHLRKAMQAGSMK